VKGRSPLADHGRGVPHGARPTLRRAGAWVLDPLDRHDQHLESPQRRHQAGSGPEGVLRGSFGLYRAWDTTLAQNEQRKSRPLTMPVLAIGGAESWGEEAGNGMKPAADDVQSVVIPGAGHWVAEQAPEEMVAVLTEFLAPYRDDG
jgi:pimeloyl-ACP methyl ester carboxylesterase